MEKKSEIEKLAYEIYVRSGYVCGRDFDHWLEAERIVCARCEPVAKTKKATVRKSSAATATPKAAKTAKPAVKTDATEKGRATGRSKKTSGEKGTSI
jgi:hypothetical protein